MSIDPRALRRDVATRCCRDRRRAVRALAAIVLIAGFAAITSASAGAAGTVNDPPRVMTQNLYLGADLAPVIAAIAASDLDAVRFAAATAFTQVRSTNFPARARAIAKEIDDWDPYLIGLQEVERWTSLDPQQPAAPEQVEFDFLAILLAELENRRLHYRVVSENQAFVAAAPAGDPYNRVIRLTDRDVILARTDLPPARFRVAGALHGTFAAVPSPPALPVTRGWASVDVQVLGRPVLRFLTTHLEPFDRDTRDDQAAELVAPPLGPLATTLPMVVAGDLNSDPTHATDAPEFASGAYQTLTRAGLRDTGNTAATCCQDADLLNPSSNLDVRIDHVLTRPGLGGLVTARLIGDTRLGPPLLPAEGPFWPSDHAGLVVGLS